MTDIHTPEETWTVLEAAQIYRVTTRTILNWIKAAELPAQKSGGRWRIPVPRSPTDVSMPASCDSPPP